MLKQIIAVALQFRMLIFAISAGVLVAGSFCARELPVDVLPDLTRPRVSIITECQGRAPEEVEQQVTIPLETSVKGAPGVISTRSVSYVGLSVINVEFDWGWDIYKARQIVQERLATTETAMPRGIQPHLGPVSSLLGQIMLIGVWCEDDSIDPIEMREYSDWVIRQKLLNLEGISQIITMGGGLKQYQILVDPHQLHKYEVSLSDIEEAIERSNINVTGGYVEQKSEELLVRGLGRVSSLDQFEKIVVKQQTERPVLLQNVANVRIGAQVKRGDAIVNGHKAVVLVIQKQPGADTRELTERVTASLDELQGNLPDGLKMEVTYEQKSFIDYGVHNVIEALQIGSFLVIIVLFLFLLNIRATIVTLLAIPLSVVVTAIVFYLMGLSINIMTLGGLAVAIGELVDDAIVGVENIFRRLKQNSQLEQPASSITVVFKACAEVRGSIFVSTVLVVVVFAPIFALSGMSGQMFQPLGIAYIVSILASTLVSLTVTPVAAYFLLGGLRVGHQRYDGFVLRGVKALASPVIKASMSRVGFVASMIVAVLAVVWSVFAIQNRGLSFLPKFDEGTAQVNLSSRPGISLTTSLANAQTASDKFLQYLATEEEPDLPIKSFTCRTGRAEMDEHVMGVGTSEFIVTLNPRSEMSRQDVIKLLLESVEEMGYVSTEADQPIAHLISHLLSGVTAEIAIKLYGENPDLLRAKAKEIEQAIAGMDGINPPVVEQQEIIPQLRIDLDYNQLAHYGLQAADVSEFIETAMNGRVVSQVYEGQRIFDVVLRFDEEFRQEIANFNRVPIDLPNGGSTALRSVAKVYRLGGPNKIVREEAKRRIVVRVNTSDRDLGSAIAEIKRRIADQVDLPDSYYIEFGGQHEESQRANFRILWLSVIALLLVFFVLYSAFPSPSIVLQILVALPAAFIGGVIALVVTQQTMTVAAMVGFISLGGIAARNGLLLISTYRDLIPQHGFNREMILRGSLERLSPVLMTALTTGIGLVPLVIGGHLPGKEILYPVATIIVGGLITSTISELFLRPGMFWFFTAKDTFQNEDAAEELVID